MGLLDSVGSNSKFSKLGNLGLKGLNLSGSGNHGRFYSFGKALRFCVEGSGKPDSPLHFMKYLDSQLHGVPFCDVHYTAGGLIEILLPAFAEDNSQ